MNRTLALIFIVAVALPVVSLAKENEVFPYPVHVETLDNGLGIVIVPMTSGGLVAYWSIVRTGSRDEYEPGRTGFAHFFEHMMYRGTEKYPAEAYNLILTEMGADANAFTSDDLTAYHMTIASEDLDRAMDIESDRFQKLDYPKDAFQTEAGAVYGEYRKNRASWFFTIIEAMQQAAYDVHTYGHTAMGFVEDIKRMPEMYDYSRSFFSRYYRPDNTVLLIVGDVEPGPTMDKVRRYYGGWERGYVAPKVRPEPEQTAERRIDVPYDGKSLPVLYMAYKADAFDPSDTTLMAADLLAELAFGETSELYRELVLDRQIVEFLWAELNVNRDPGLFDIMTRIKDPEQIAYVEQRIEAAIERYRDEPPAPARLAAAKSRRRYEFLMSLDSPDRVASALARIIAVTGGVEAVESMFRTIDDVSADDVRNAARKYFVDSRRTVALLRGQD